MRIHQAAITALCCALAANLLAAAETAGIGIALEKRDGKFAVKAILPDSPAAGHRGIGLGDRLLAVGQENAPAVELRGQTLVEVVALVRGPRGSTVRLTIVPRDGDDADAKVVSLVRGEIAALARWGDGVRLGSGTRAPDAPLIHLDSGQAERLADHAGKIVVIEFWATWCGPCQKLLAELQEFPSRHPEWKDKVVLIAASVDEEQVAAVEHLKEMGWHGTRNVWADVAAVKAFHVDGLPTIYVIDAGGRIADIDAGESLEATVERLLSDG
jgi:thiol-disulfide isomerase/thioredoxin